MSFNKREFEQLPDWLQECWNLSPAIARKAEKYIDSIKPLSSDAVLDDVRAILNGIVNPIQYMQRIAKESGSSIDGRAAVELANDVSYYRALAKEALEKLASISA